MSGKSSQKDRINKAYHIMQKTVKTEKEDKDKIEAMLYAMADKFPDILDLKKLKEELSMTKLGQMIWENGIAEGETRRETKGRLSAYLEMIRDGFITKEEAAIRLEISLDELNILLNNKVSV